MYESFSFSILLPVILCNFEVSVIPVFMCSSLSEYWRNSYRYEINIEGDKEKKEDSLNDAVGGGEHVLVGDECSSTELRGFVPQQSSNPWPLFRVRRLTPDDPRRRRLGDQPAPC